MKRSLTPEDLFALRSVADVTMSQDGQTVAFTITQPDRETDTYKSQIYHYKEGQPHQITSGHSDTQPTISGDGSKIAFLRNEPKEPPQPWVHDLATGEESQIATFEDGATQIAWGYRHLYVRAAARPADQIGVDKETLQSKIRIVTDLNYRSDGVGWTHDRKQQVYRCSLRGGTPKLLTDDRFNHGAFAIRPDGASLLVVNQSDADSDLSGTSHVWQIDTVQGDKVCLTPAAGSWNDVGWGVGDKPFAIGVLDASRDLLNWPFALAQGQPPAPLVTHDVNHFSAIGGTSRPAAIASGLLVTANRRGMTNLDRVHFDGTPPKTVVEGPFVVGGFATNSAGTTIFASVSTQARPAELWKFENGLSSVVVSLNDELLDEIEIARTTSVRVPSTDGVEVEAWVVTPPSCVASDKPGPGLVYIHGGPFSNYGYTFFDEFQLAAAEGYVVIGGNPRGSDGYGDEWGRAVLGTIGASDWDDVQALTEYLANREDVDADRIGIGGGSYGGFMTAWAISHSDRYSAALLERGLYNAETFMGTSDIATFFGRYLFGADPETDVEKLRRISPTTYAAQITTPSLIIHAENDFRCPIEQAEQLFATLRRVGTEATFVRVPDESHGLTRNGSPHHRVDRFAIVHDFYNKHLKSS